MALELPGWLVTAFNLVGLPWPGIDEDELRAWATSVRTFADGITASSARTHAAIAGLADDSQSSFTNALAARSERHNQLVADLHGPMNDFADALDVAADVVVAQKEAVIAAAAVLAAEFVGTQIGAIFTLGADEAALPEEIISTRELVKFALEYLEAELMGKLIGIAAQAISDAIGRFLSNLLGGVVLPVAMEAQSLKLSYNSLRDTAQSIRGQATEIEETGDAAHSENANRDIEDGSEGGDDGGDGGQWAAVVQAVEQALLELAGDLFKNVSQAIADDQNEAANLIDTFVNDAANTDRTAAADVPKDSGQGPSAEPSAALTPSPADEQVPQTDDSVADGGDSGGDGEPPTGGPAESGPEDPFDPAFQQGALGSQFSPGVLDPEGVFSAKERAVADRLAQEGWRVDARKPDPTVENLKNPDAMVRKGPDDPGSITEFKTLKSSNNNALKREINDASDQAGADGDVVMDGRGVNTTQSDAERAYKRALGQPGKIVSQRVHVILGDNTMITFEKD